MSAAAAHDADLPATRDVIVRLAIAGTAVHAVAAVVGVASPGLRGVHTVVAIALFVAGLGLTAAGFAAAVARSGRLLIDVIGLFWLVGPVAPRGVKAWLRGCLVAEVAIGVAAAAARPYTAMATSVLIPIWALGLLVLWAGRRASFPVRPERPGR